MPVKRRPIFDRPEQTSDVDEVEMFYRICPLILTIVDLEDAVRRTTHRISVHHDRGLKAPTQALAVWERGRFLLHACWETRPRNPWPKFLSRYLCLGLSNLRLTRTLSCKLRAQSLPQWSALWVLRIVCLLEPGRTSCGWTGVSRKLDLDGLVSNSRYIEIFVLSIVIRLPVSR